MPPLVNIRWVLDGIFEPSAVQQLPDGRFLVVEDDKRRPFSAVTFEDDANVRSQPLSPSLFQLFNSAWQLDDLEGLTMDGAGHLYAITSHSRDDEGAEKASREKLVRFRVDGRHVVEPRVVTGLKRALIDTYPALAASASVLDVKGRAGLNIEGLAIDPSTDQLLIGFRSPLAGSKAVVACLRNTADVFDSGAVPDLDPNLEELDLGGRGIRGLSHIPSLSAYLVIGGPVDKADSGFGLWLWEPRGLAARPLGLPAGVDLSHAEGVAAATLDGAERIVVVCDDGDRKSGRSATAWLLDPRDLGLM
jgi:hypothetical protein